jgi:hypothetical protein
LAGLIAVMLLSSRTLILRLTPFPNSPEILALKGREIATRLGYTDPPVDSFDVFSYETEYHDWAERNLKKEDYREQVRLGQPSLIYFTHRESPDYLVPRDPTGQPTPNDPPTNVSGMVSLDLDPQGRLIRFLGVPPQRDDGAPAQPMDWKKLFDAAGLDPSRWTEAASQEIPPYSFDERKAWVGSVTPGTFAHAPNLPMRIEAAAWKGRPVAFELFGPWRRPARMQPRAPQTTGQRIVSWSSPVLISIVLVGALWLAWRNYRAGRADTRGALRLAATGLIFESLAQIVRLHHIPAQAELGDLMYAIHIGLFVAAGVGVLYLALEPYLRRRWPQSLISWTRLLAGDVRDPLVAGHILIGSSLGVVVGLLDQLRKLFDWQSSGVLRLSATTINTLHGAGLAGWLLSEMIEPASIAMGVFFLFFLFRLALRNTWLAAAAFVVLWGGLNAATAANPIPSALYEAAQYSLIVRLMIRFGILPLTLFIILSDLVMRAPLTSDLSAWYADKGLIVAALVLALAVWSFRNALGGRKVLKGDFLES